MGIISKIGPLELSFILFLAVLFFYRLQAAPESRAATALVFILLSRFGASFINGFAVSESTKSAIGQLDTVFAYLMLAFAFLEVLLLKHVNKWESTDLWILASLFGIGFLNFTWKLTFNAGVSANDFLYGLPIILFLALRPTKVDLRFLPYFGAAMIFLVLLTALAKYQNPLFPYHQVDYGLGSQYQNRIWDFFGFRERFRGPYFHPNQLGIQLTFLSLLVLLKASKFYLLVLPISYTLLFLASSRTSILALTVGVLLKLYFDMTRAANICSPGMGQDFSKHHSRSRFTLRKIILGIVAAACAAMVGRQIIGSNTTGTGRVENYRVTISAIKENLLVGKGPLIFSINSTENTYLTILSFYGIVGLALVILVVFCFAKKYKGINHNETHLFKITCAIFFIASSGESILTGSAIDTGLYYLLVLCSLTRSEPSIKARVP